MTILLLIAVLVLAAAVGILAARAQTKQSATPVLPSLTQANLSLCPEYLAKASLCRSDLLRSQRSLTLGQFRTRVADIKHGLAACGGGVVTAYSSRPGKLRSVKLVKCTGLLCLRHTGRIRIANSVLQGLPQLPQPGVWRGDKRLVGTQSLRQQPVGPVFVDDGLFGQVHTAALNLSVIALEIRMIGRVVPLAGNRVLD